jgi:hypothetical protein
MLPFLGTLRECGEDANLDRGVGLRAGGDDQKAAPSERVPLHIDADLSVTIFEKNLFPVPKPRDNVNCQSAFWYSPMKLIFIPWAPS